MIDKTKLAKFMQRLEGLIARLDRKKEPLVHQKINPFYYRQKREELRLLLEQFEETEKRKTEIASLINEDYALIFKQWRKDVRWLNAHRQKQQTKPVL
jgi:hypothetical protein